MIAEVLSRRYVLEQLQQVEQHLQILSSQNEKRQGFLATYPGVAPEHVSLTLDSLQQAHAREIKRGQPGSVPAAREQLIAPAAPVDDRSFFSRDPIISIFQSALEEYLETQKPQQILTRQPANAARPSDFAITNRKLASTPVTGQSQGVGFLGQFDPTDPGWISAAVSKGISLFRGKRDFNQAPATPLPISDKARVLLVGDWGTGLPRAQKVADRMRAVLDEGIASNREQHVIHLGDVYYSGWEREYRNRFVPYWPVKPEESGTITSWSLNGNHDMYSGGYAYYDFLLKDPRFKKQEQSSFFRLYNNSWDILALDTAWDDAGLFNRQGVLKDPQADWIRSMLNQSSRKTTLLSHHQLFSVYDGDTLKLDDKLKSVLDTNRIAAWFWGHEHRCMLFDSYDEVQYARCLGNGGVPVYMTHNQADPCPYPGEYEYRAFVEEDGQRYGLFGFAVLDFDGAQCTARYIDENGKEFLKEFIPTAAVATVGKNS